MNIIIVNLRSLRDENGDHIKWVHQKTREANHLDVLEEFKKLDYIDTKNAMKKFVDGETIDIVSKNKRVVIVFVRTSFRGKNNPNDGDIPF